MFSLLSKNRDAHKSAISSCGWGVYAEPQGYYNEIQQNDLHYGRNKENAPPKERVKDTDRERERDRDGEQHKENKVGIGAETVGKAKKKIVTVVHDVGGQDEEFGGLYLDEFIVTGGLDNLVKTWTINDDHTLSLKHEFKGHEMGVVSVAVSRNGYHIGSTDLDSVLCLWNACTGELRHTIRFGPADLWAVDFSPCSKYVVAGSTDGRVPIFSVEDGGFEKLLCSPKRKFTLSVAYSPDGNYVASGSTDGVVTIFDVTTGQVVKTMVGHSMPVKDICFSPVEHILLSASYDGFINVYDLSQGCVVHAFSYNKSWPLSVSFSHDGRHFASSSADSTVQVWDFTNGKPLFTYNEHAKQSWCTRYGPPKGGLVSVSEDRSVNLYSMPKDL